MVARIRWAVLIIVACVLFVFVYGQLTYKAVYSSYTYVVDDTAEAQVTAVAYGAFALHTGEPLIGKSMDEAVPIASLTKLMTALVALEEMDLNATATASYAAVATEGRAGRLQVGDSLLVRELLFPLLLESSNDAAEVLADAMGRTAMLDAMNRRAALLGMSNTAFADPSGLSKDNVGTVNDLVTLIRTLRDTHPYVLDITQLPAYIGENHMWRNGDLIALRGDFRGGKNGYTDEALHTFSGIFEVELRDGSVHPVAIVVLGSDDMEGDIERILATLKAHVSYTYVI